jgi:hypothetical protein
MSRRQLVKRLRAMPMQERQAFVWMAWDRDGSEAVADKLHLPVPIVMARFTRGVRRFWDASSAAHPLDVAVAEYLDFRGTTLQRDELAYRLRARGVDPLELDELDAAMICVRRSRRRGLRALREARLSY